MRNIDINCDMGEQTHLYAYDVEKDLALLQHISSVNLACGFHAGDAHTMHVLVEAAIRQKIAIGAHPSYPDKENFGRTAMQLPPETIYDIVLYQIGALHAFVKIYGSRLHHVKAHGALYNMAAISRPVANAICNAIKDFDPALVVYGLSGSEMISSAQDLGLQTASEVFADRRYRNDGTLIPRTEANALIDNEHDALQQVLQMVRHGTVTVEGNTTVSIQAETICIHGDGLHALPFAISINNMLKQHHVSIQQP